MILHIYRLQIENQIKFKANNKLLVFHIVDRWFGREILSIVLIAIKNLKMIQSNLPFTLKIAMRKEEGI